MADIDITNPEDNDLVSAYPTNERDSRTAIAALFAKEHDVSGGIGEGRHKFPMLDEATRDAQGDWQAGSILWNTDKFTMQINVGTMASPSWFNLGPQPGAITAWSGIIASVPDGWVLCDGTDGTPDLTGAFVRGAGGGFSTGVTGGSTSHNHGGSTGNHTLTTSQIPSHAHSVSGLSNSAAGGHDGHVEAGGAFPDIAAGNDFSIVSEPNHTHNISGPTDSTGGGNAHNHSISSENHLPTFHQLAYIMKT